MARGQVADFTIGYPSTLSFGQEPKAEQYSSQVTKLSLIERLVMD